MAQKGSWMLVTITHRKKFLVFSSRKHAWRIIPARSSGYQPPFISHLGDLERVPQPLEIIRKIPTNSAFLLLKLLPPKAFGTRITPTEMTHPPTDSQSHKLSPKNSLRPFFGVKTWSFQRLLVTSNARNQRFVASLFALGDVFSLPFTAWVGPNVDPTLGQTLMGQTQRTSRRAVKPWQWGGAKSQNPWRKQPNNKHQAGEKTHEQIAHHF